MSWGRIGRKDQRTKDPPASNQAVTAVPANRKVIFTLKARDLATSSNKCLEDGKGQAFRLKGMAQILTHLANRAVQCPEETLKGIFSLPLMKW